MGVAIPAGYAQCIPEFSLSGTTHLSTFTMGMKGAPGDSASDIGVAFDAALTAVGSLVTAAGMILGWTYLGTTTTLMTETGPLVSVDGAPIAGSAVASALPINCALLVSKITGRGGRKGRGRFYIPPFTVAEGAVNAAGQIDSGDITSLQSKVNVFFAAISGLEPFAVLLHEDGTLPDEITAMTVQGTIATQRRRMR